MKNKETRDSHNCSCNLPSRLQAGAVKCVPFDRSGALICVPNQFDGELDMNDGI